ncbi:MAG: HD domain-containing protein [Pirellulaceae bacterium]|nr:HD domain-containing protein [Pirellulaceae bacterium]
MNNSLILSRTADHVRKLLEGDSAGHDWWHIERVRRIALTIAREERANLFLVELGALLHDVADWKFAGGDEQAGPAAARTWLDSLEVDAPTTDHVCRIIAQLSFKGAGVATPMDSLEGACVQDADRLEALGAIGIARTFAYGGWKGQPMHDPDLPPQLHGSFLEYKRIKGTTINHFYEKLLLLKDRMNTAAGKRLALARHDFMQQYLDQFMAEWDGVK